MGLGAFFVGVVEDAEPVELCVSDELLQNVKVRGGLAGEADDKGGAEGDAGNGGADFLDGLEEDFGSGSALHALEDIGRGVLERNVEVLADVVVLRDCLKELAGNAVRVG